MTISNESWNKYKNLDLIEIQKQRIYSFIQRRYLNNKNADMKDIFREYNGNLVELTHVEDKGQIRQFA